MSSESSTTDEGLAPPEWMKSVFSGNGGACVKVAVRRTDGSPIENGMILVGDTKDPQGRPLRFTHAEWQAFVDGIENRAITVPVA